MKKVSNKILAVTLVVLFAGFVLARVFRAPGLESNLRKTLVQLDTAKVTAIHIQSAGQAASEIKLVKEGKDWSVVSNNQKSASDVSAVKSMLGVLSGLRTQRLASRKKDKWETYKVDEKGTHVAIFGGDSKIADLNVGKTGFSQGSYGNGAFTYVRLSDEDEVYAVDGAVDSYFNKSFDDWRNKSFLRLKRDDVVKLTFRYPADSGFIAEKRDSIWYVANDKAEVNKIQKYLGQLASKNISDFAKSPDLQNEPSHTLVIEGKNGTLATVDAWRNAGKWILSSSLQKGVYFSADSTKFNQLFVGKKFFIP